MNDYRSGDVVRFAPTGGEFTFDRLSERDARFGWVRSAHGGDMYCFRLIDLRMVIQQAVALPQDEDLGPNHDDSIAECIARDDTDGPDCSVRNA